MQALPYRFLFIRFVCGVVFDLWREGAIGELMLLLALFFLFGDTVLLVLLDIQSLPDGLVVIYRSGGALLVIKLRANETTQGQSQTKGGRSVVCVEQTGLAHAHLWLERAVFHYLALSLLLRPCGKLFLASGLAIQSLVDWGIRRHSGAGGTLRTTQSGFECALFVQRSTLTGELPGPDLLSPGFVPVRKEPKSLSKRDPGVRCGGTKFEVLTIARAAACRHQSGASLCSP